MHDMIGLVLMTTSIEIHGKNLKEGSNPICLAGASFTFQILRMKFS